MKHQISDYINYMKSKQEGSSPWHLRATLVLLARNHCFPVKHKQFHKTATSNKATLQLGWIRAKTRPSHTSVGTKYESSLNHKNNQTFPDPGYWLIWMTVWTVPLPFLAPPTSISMSFSDWLFWLLLIRTLVITLNPSEKSKLVSPSYTHLNHICKIFFAMQGNIFRDFMD